MSQNAATTETGLARETQPSSDGRVWAYAAVIAAVTIWAYGNSFRVPFLFDDTPSIPKNATIRQIWPLSGPLTPPVISSTYGRPLLNLSFAVNYAVSERSVFGYHAVNLCIHILAALTLFGIVRRTLQRPALAGRFGNAAVPLAGAIALLWAVHPLQTMAVTYIVQRAESMAALFFLLTLYALLRGATGGRAWAWYAAAWAACLAAAFTKETMAPLPVVALLYDRTFLAGSFRGALRRRWAVYLLLAACWAPLGWLIHSAGGRNDTAGFAIGVTAWQYALTEAGVILHYLRLAFWPDVLVLDYGWPLASWPGAALPAAVVVAMLAATAWALWRKPAAGFLAAWFFLTLAVTSSVVPIKDPAFEQRMYLALAGVVALVVMGAWVLLRALPSRLPAAVPIAAAALAALTLAARTHARNYDYRTAEAIWRTVVESRPQNARARNNLGNALADTEKFPQAVEQFREAIRLQPDFADAHYDLGNALYKLGRKEGRLEEAVEEYKDALRIKPKDADALGNLSLVLVDLKRYDEAIECCRKVLQIRPKSADAHYIWGTVLERQGKYSAAVEQFQEVLLLKPRNDKARESLLRVQGRLQRGGGTFRP
ncbi:MAG: tetratricopeptide repeat protein [Planctomycetota bacterium]|nr:tetratricopeptide repeat protein [Planctomycetota bacterium]